MDLVLQRFQISDDETINYDYKIIVYISFLLLLQLITTNFVKNTQIYFPIVPALKNLKWKVLAGMYSFWRRQRMVCFFAFSSFYTLPIFLGS